MWKWILDKLQQAANTIPIYVTGITRDDIVGNVSLYLCQNKDIAKNIYENKEIGLLYCLVKREIYEINSKIYFKNKMELSRYQRIINLCEEYEIEPEPENAYKISALMNDKFSNFTISGVAALLSIKVPSKQDFICHEYELLENIASRSEDF